MTTVCEAAFREALAQFGSGVTVVTARGSVGPVGFTASAFTSVSLAPPLVLVCVAGRASAHDVVVAADAFGVNVLSERQQWVAEQFARSGVDRFERVPLRAEHPGGVPLVEGAIVHLGCRRYAAQRGGGRPSRGRRCRTRSRPLRNARAVQPLRNDAALC
jgi:flavin reductase (DIM6/NTAB) family NADH-FMN oxidoreductase RutF